MNELSKRLRTLCGNCILAPHNRNAEHLKPCCDSCEMKWQAADETDRLQSDADAMAEWRERANSQFQTNQVLRDELGRLRTAMDADKRRLAWLAGCGSDDGPVIEGFALLLDDFWSFLGDAIRERIGEENDSPDIEGTDGDKLAAFRAMIDSAIAAEKARAP